MDSFVFAQRLFDKCFVTVVQVFLKDLLIVSEQECKAQKRHQAYIMRGGFEGKNWQTLHSSRPMLRLVFPLQSTQRFDGAVLTIWLD